MTGLRIDTALSKIRNRLAKLKRDTSASEFRPELAEFTRRTLNDCIRTTPARSEALIAKNQHVQYQHRVNSIPSFHELLDPSLRVNAVTGEAWIFYAGKWYNAAWHLPSEVYAAFGELNAERNRRLSTIEAQFIAQRKQARFLYRKSWWQVAQSLGLSIVVPSDVIESHSRHNPRKEPPRAYGQWRGGQRVLSVVIQNPFLDVPTMYWKGNGKAILAEATARNRAWFNKAVHDKTERNISAARRMA